jgi:hypothetical protein
VVRAVRAEWTKLRSQRGTALALLAVVGFTLLLSILSASLGKSSVNDSVLTVDQFHFVHQPMTGDGTLTVRITSQTDSGAWAKAGIMVKANATSGSPYAALMVTPRHGVLMQADARTELAGPVRVLPCWLRLTRSGQTVAGYESADGRSWTRVGVVTVADLPAHAEAGLFVASPPAVRIMQFQSHSYTMRDPTVGRASFDHVTVTAAGAAASAWHDADVTPPPPTHEPRGAAPQPDAGGGPLYAEIVPGSSARDRDGTITVTGSGDIGRVGMGGISLADMDRVTATLVGVHLGLIGAVALGVLSMTSEFKTGMIATTFAASPNRGAVLAAKAVAVTAVMFVTGLGASLAAFFTALPLQRRNGYRPPVYPEPSVTDPAVLRAIIGTAAFLALIALFSLAVGALARRTAGAVVVLFALLVVIPTVVAGTSASADTWIRRATPIAGLSIQQTMTFPPGSSEVVTGTWTGFLVLCGYTLVALVAAFQVLRKRDV